MNVSNITTTIVEAAALSSNIEMLNYFISLNNPKILKSQTIFNFVVLNKLIDIFYQLKSILINDKSQCRKHYISTAVNEVIYYAALTGDVEYFSTHFSNYYISYKSSYDKLKAYAFLSDNLEMYEYVCNTDNINCPMSIDYDDNEKFFNSVNLNTALSFEAQSWINNIKLKKIGRREDIFLTSFSFRR